MRYILFHIREVSDEKKTGLRRLSTVLPIVSQPSSNFFFLLIDLTNSSYSRIKFK